ncbi:GAF domain-like protein [Calycina marina]|uniref:GAF domain-like protein n=1 Tax=Calycina marina TaxID=1763456 RepID=A0A9P7Z3K9_9HELO|nr:GAF domain-like protein [Calycina marina]
MVHADSSNFASGISKEGAYKHVLEQAEALFQGQTNWVCNLANTSSLLWHAFHSLPSPSSDVNWAGFYTIDPKKANQLILGPFHGKVACETIAFSRGVCGAAARDGSTKLVQNVRAFPGHIACDGASMSEIVVPIIVDGEVKAIIDVDCAVKSGFDEVDQLWLEKLAALLAESCEW